MNESQGHTVGPWTLRELLGRGGNGSVWKATRSDAETAVALKVLNVRKVESESYQRWRRCLPLWLRSCSGRGTRRAAGG